MQPNIFAIFLLSISAAYSLPGKVIQKDARGLSAVVNVDGLDGKQFARKAILFVSLLAG